MGKGTDAQAVIDNDSGARLMDTVKVTLRMGSLLHIEELLPCQLTQTSIRPASKVVSCKCHQRDVH